MHREGSIRALIAARTWPERWSDDDLLADVPLASEVPLFAGLGWGAP